MCVAYLFAGFFGGMVGMCMAYLLRRKLYNIISRCRS